MEKQTVDLILYAKLLVLLSVADEQKDLVDPGWVEIAKIAEELGWIEMKEFDRQSKVPEGWASVRADSAEEGVAYAISLVYDGREVFTEYKEFAKKGGFPDPTFWAGFPS